LSRNDLTGSTAGRRAWPDTAVGPLASLEWKMPLVMTTVFSAGLAGFLGDVRDA
jgi:hypothetical protein